MVSLSGQPETVSSTVTATAPSVVDVHGLDHAEVGDRPADLRVVDGRERSVDLLESRGRSWLPAYVGHREAGTGQRVPVRVVRARRPRRWRCSSSSWSSERSSERT